jgi:hypothetical protein
MAVHGHVDERITHAVEMVIGEPEAIEGRKFVGYLFSKTKNAIAGWATGGDVPVGFYMTKLSGPTGSHVEGSSEA